MTVNLQLGDTQLIMQECRSFACTRQQTAYILATAFWETAQTMKPVKEAYWLSENWRKNNLRYYPWYGRGYVQLTWEENYEKAQRKLNLGTMLTSNPDRAMTPKYAAKILVQGMMDGWFTGKPLTKYIDGRRTDYLNARRVVNLMDKAGTIRGLALKYEAALENAKPAKYQPPTSGDFFHWLLKLLTGGNR
jgi:putative chitinase